MSFDASVQQAIGQWGLRDGNARMISHRENAVFAIRLNDGQPAALRLHRPGYNSVNEIWSELWWTNALAEAGFPAPKPVATPDETLLVNSYFPAYGQAKAFPHNERRRRKLLVSKRELAKLWQGIGREGMTLVPLRLYFNEKGRAKLKLGIAKGKKVSDKRETEKKRDWQRQKARLLRDRG